MTLDQTIDALILLRSKMQKQGLRTDILCGFYDDSPRDLVHVTLIQKDIDRIMEDPSLYIAPNDACVVIPLQDAIEGERK